MKAKKQYVNRDEPDSIDSRKMTMKDKQRMAEIIEAHAPKAPYKTKSTKAKKANAATSKRKRAA
ncbi:MAG TPA: hypothetical protein VK826_10090 [Bacteroidia bacterium]|nr:hypothetical protein [Bacteroidia bacterium]